VGILRLLLGIHLNKFNESFKEGIFRIQFLSAFSCPSFIGLVLLIKGDEDKYPFLRY
jgi:hypothetical protein